MKLRTTLVLLIIALAMGAFIFGLDRWSQSTRERRERAAHVVSVTRANIEGFTIRDGDELIRVKAEGDAWKMIAVPFMLFRGWDANDDGAPRHLPRGAQSALGSLPQ
jgi:hypothetical protein